MSDVKTDLRRLFQEDGVEVSDLFLDRILEMLRPAAAQTLDREKAKAVFRQRYIEHTTVDQALDYLERCLRPMDGVTLTREEATDIARVLRNTGGRDVLAARLEAAS